MKGVNWVHNDKIRSNGLERSQLGTQWSNGQKSFGYTIEKSGHMVLKGVIGYTMEKSGHMVLKGVNWVHNTKIRSMVLKTQFVYTMIKLGQMVLKGVNWVHNAKIRSYGLERSQLCTQW